MKTNNKCEVAAATRYEKEGWKVVDSGWPDFLLYRWSGGEIEVKFSEVKSETAAVRDNQETVLRILSQLAPAVVCREQHNRFSEKRVLPIPQDEYYHRTDKTPWERCLRHETCSVRYHVCEPRNGKDNGC